MNTATATHPQADSFVYISHSRRDEPTLARLCADLQRAGFACRVDRSARSPGMPAWQRSTLAAVRTAHAVIWLVSPLACTSPHGHDEIAAARMVGSRIYPLWVAGDTWEACVPSALAGIDKLDLRGAGYAAGFETLVAALRGEGPAPTLADAVTVAAASASDAPPRNPYKGLSAFTEADHGDFFGREALIADLLRGIGEQHDAARLLALIGPEGVGKSSVLLAGLLPRLRAGDLPGSGDWCYLEPMRPGAQPLSALTLVLQEQVPMEASAIRAMLEQPHGRGLHDLVQALDEPRVILCLDQFEELFAAAVAEHEREQFIALLITALTEPDGKLFVVLTLRADQYDQPQRYPALAQLISTHQRPVVPLTLTELHAAITRPTALPNVGLSFEPGVAGEIAAAFLDADAAHSRLPLIQFALMQLVARRAGSSITREAYHALGGVNRALDHAAEAAVAALDAETQLALPHLLRRLIIVDDRGAAQRQPAPWAAFAGDAAAHQLITALRDAGLLRDADGADPAAVIFAHDLVLSGWERLVQWAEQTAEDQRLLRRVRAAAAAWDAAGRPADQLWSHSQLKAVFALRERLGIGFDPVVGDFVHSEIDRLLAEFRNPQTPAHRHLKIIERLEDIGAEAAPALIQVLLHTRDFRSAEAAEGSLRRFADAAVPYLATTLHSEDVNARLIAVEALNGIGTQAAAQTLLTALIDGSSAVRQATFKALRALPDAQTIPALRQALRSENIDLRRFAVGLLGMSQAPESVPALSQALRDESVEVRRLAVEMLGRKPTENASLALSTAIEDQEPTVRKAALAMLQRAGERDGHELAAISSEASDADVASLIKVLRDGSGHVRLNAVIGLGQIGGEAVVPALVAVLQDPDPGVRRTAAETLGRLGTQRAIPGLTRALHDRDAFVRIAASKALKKIGKPELDT
ncbi:MAG: TIR domain-containing protein [Chloroflexi bacterium]|nr:TIR domain-containing protein [Chloroflexota bacterium]